MRTNEALNIKTDWQITNIVKPAHINALTQSVQYDYVVTGQMLEGKTGNVPVFELLHIGIAEGTLVPGDTHILINTPVPDDVVLVFPGNQAGPSGHFSIHIHSLGAFKADCTGSSEMISFFFHTHGISGAVTLLGLSAHMYVGSFVMETRLPLPGSSSTFTYEMALGELPTPPEVGGEIQQSAWMSNALNADRPDPFIDIGTEDITITSTSPYAISSEIHLPEGVTPESLIDQIDAVLSRGILPVIRFQSSVDLEEPSGHSGDLSTTFAPLVGIRCYGFFFKDPIPVIRGRYDSGSVEEADVAMRYIYIGIDGEDPARPAVVRRQEWRTV